MQQSDIDIDIDIDIELIDLDPLELSRPPTIIDVPAGYLALSEAIHQLSAGMWGGLQRPGPVVAIKKSQKKSSVGYGPWKEKAGRCLTTVVKSGNLNIYVVHGRPIRSEDYSRTICSPQQKEPVALPAIVVERLIATRGSLPDCPIRPSIRTADDNHRIFELLTDGRLVLRASDFEVWYRAERAKGRWPSQRSKRKVNGRPTKRTERLRNAVLALVNDKKWNGQHAISKLHRMLIDAGHSDLPSQDTLARLVDDLHSETGEAALMRLPRVRRNQAHLISP